MIVFFSIVVDIHSKPLKNVKFTPYIFKGMRTTTILKVSKSRPIIVHYITISNKIELFNIFVYRKEL